MSKTFSTFPMFIKVFQIKRDFVGEPQIINGKIQNSGKFQNSTINKIKQTSNTSAINSCIIN